MEKVKKVPPILRHLYLGQAARWGRTMQPLLNVRTAARLNTSGSGSHFLLSANKLHPNIDTFPMLMALV